MSRIARQYVVTPSVALYGSLSPELLSAQEQTLAFACHAFLARAAFHRVTLNVPMLFYSQVIESAFALHQEGYISFEDCQALARAILDTSWEYHLVNSDEILSMQRRLTMPNRQGDAEYFAIALEQQCPIITTQAHPLEIIAGLEVLQVQTHSWADNGALEDHPPEEL
jgi:hypothetical protein